MIDARELKIGNYVYLQSSKTPCRITEIGYSEIEYPRYEASGRSSEAVFRTYVDNLKTILLTAQLLLNCGFVYNAIDDCFDRLNLRIRILGNSICAFIGFEVGLGKEWHDANIEVKSLHQLQNLYFALTGKELEVDM